ncbi:GDSL esterase/lipase At4g10955-like [Salvia hispanica]|uniref:GDSL esterase/lipase At4g10955-like n=1 Tax=Salvia hispanica TaxID=49212 RepID=UPI002009A085|nr:GDSL esterase/lipase At4g10955-like [Salvia hispanica]XP_047973822.1 GDSL esterase/lipase At4g10955-like [Salvia hispanica]
MGRKSQNFSTSGPTFLTAVDWSNSHHRRSVAACLVQGVYTLEEDRRRGRAGPDALAPPWWHSFNFLPIQILVDNHDLSIYGAVFEFTNYPYHNHEAAPTAQRPPRYMIAFRGTILKPGNRKQDLKLDFHLWLNDHKNSTRFHTGLETVSQVIQYGHTWLAGHSLGSSLALAIGREMAKCHGIHIETYLFNPPFITLPIEWIKSKTVKFGLRIISSAITAGVAAIAGAGAGSREMDSFTALPAWVPYLFVSRSDPISSEYAGYFKHRGDMEAIGAGGIERVATENALGSIFSSCEALHLLPSAYLSINGSAAGFREAHGISQWWRHELELEYKYYLHN